MQQQHAPADPLAGLSPGEARRLIRDRLAAGTLTPNQARALLKHWPLYRRANQIWPERRVRGVVDRKGRGAGKTRRGSEECWIRARQKERGIILVGRTLDEVRQVMIGGPSGLEACARPGEWVDIAINSTVGKLMPYKVPIYLRSDEKPKKIRGINAAFAWMDEIAQYRRALDVLMNVEFATRLGRAQWLVTTTPLPTRFIKELVVRDDVHVDEGSMYENREYLADSFISDVERIYKGTIFEDQEVYGKIVDSVDGALWRMDWIEDNRVDEDTRGFSGLTVSFDPSSSNSTDADEHGIILAGSGRGEMAKHLYVIDDKSGRMEVEKAAGVAVDLAIEWNCDIVYEGNNGGEWIRLTLKAVLSERQAKVRADIAAKLLPANHKIPHVEFHAVTASASKEHRAFPVSVEYKNGTCHHLGTFPALESQQVGWVPSRRNIDGQEKSPGRIDALVWAWYWLILAKGARGSWSELLKNPKPAATRPALPRY